MKYIVLINPLAGDVGTAKADERVKLNGEIEYRDITKIENLQAFLNEAGESAGIVVAGGDGTLNRFINAVDCDSLKNPVFLFPAGNGNDFYNDIVKNYKELCPPAEENNPVLRIDGLLKNLPSVAVNGKTYKFLNGVGYGIDGYCCEVGDKLKAAGKKVNYTSIAIKGLLFHFKPRGAEITVDGVKRNFKKVWIAPSMNGSFYGGGMIPTPSQNRISDKLSVCVMYGKGKIATLMAFPSIFKGEHVKKTKMVEILQGREITVKFEKPCALQIDGETILNVSEYTAKR